MKTTKLIAFILLIPTFSFAATDPATFLDGLTAHVNGALLSSGIVAVVLEFVFRLIPTKKPLGWAWLLTNALHSLGRLSETTAKFLDSVLPQNTDNQNPKV